MQPRSSSRSRLGMRPRPRRAPASGSPTRRAPPRRRRPAARRRRPRGSPVAHGQRRVVQQADHADHRRRMDRPAEVLVVEGDVARHHRQAERLAGQRHALDRLGQLVADLAASRGCRSSGSSSSRRAARPCRRRCGPPRDDAHPAAPRVERTCAGRCRRGDRDRARRGRQPHHRGVAARPQDRARADQLIVLPRHPPPAAAVRSSRAAPQRRRRGRPARPQTAAARSASRAGRSCASS